MALHAAMRSFQIDLCGESRLWILSLIKVVVAIKMRHKLLDIYESG